MLNSVIDTIYTIYQVNCTLSNNYLKYVYCSQLDEKLNFTQIAITISLGTTKVLFFILVKYSLSQTL